LQAATDPTFPKNGLIPLPRIPINLEDILCNYLEKLQLASGKIFKQDAVRRETCPHMSLN
jgi:hypothetical protein